MSEQQRQARDLDRAWHWGQRYARNRWCRLPPPRFRAKGPRDDYGVATTAAFLRGYDAQVRTMIRQRARTDAALAWPIGAAS